MPGGGTWVGFGADGVRQQIGVGVHVLMPGDSPGRYHAESDQEGFLVLSGECILIVEGEERRLQQWDYFHCPPGRAHHGRGERGAVRDLHARRRARPASCSTTSRIRSAAKHGAAVDGADGQLARGLRRPGPHVHGRQGSLAAEPDARRRPRPRSRSRPERGRPSVAAPRSSFQVPSIRPSDHQRGGQDAAAGPHGACRARGGGSGAVAVAEQDAVEHRQQADVRRRAARGRAGPTRVRPSTSTSSSSSSP